MMVSLKPKSCTIQKTPSSWASSNWIFKEFLKMHLPHVVRYIKIPPACSIVIFTSTTGHTFRIPGYRDTIISGYSATPGIPAAGHTFSIPGYRDTIISGYSATPGIPAAGHTFSIPGYRDTIISGYS
jgi:hypothetical protein